MKIKLFKEYGALNSVNVFKAFELGIIANGDELVDTYEEADVVVIWSVLFQGRMSDNQHVWENSKIDKKPIIVLEVGTLLRNVTWRVGIGGINRDATWGEWFYEDPHSRRSKFGINLKEWQDNSKEFITIATQRPDSLQWEGMPSIEEWIDKTISQVKEVSDRQIVIRPHPRDKITNWKKVYEKNPNVVFDIPRSIGEYDKVNFRDILSRTHILINYCTSPAIECVIEGIPVVVGEPSMAWNMGTEIENIENPNKPDRSVWFDQLLHTEWFTHEIEAGIPWKKLRNMV